MKAALLVLFVSAVLHGASPEIGGCAVFPSNNAWNTPVDRLPVDARSADYVQSAGADRPLHPDFGTGGAIPYVIVKGDQPRVPVTFQYAGESAPGPYPVPPDAPVEGGPASTGDRHVLVVDRDACKLYELFSAYRQPDGSWRAGSGAVFDLRSNALRPAGWTSSDAAGLPVLPGLVRYDEVAAGEIRHAIRFTVARTRRAYVWPARHFASASTDPQLPPMGQRFRLKAGVDLSGFSKTNQVILRALQKYGMILADNGSNWFITGAPDPRWSDEDLHQLQRLHGADFEAVDASSLMVDPDSGGARAPRGLDAVVNAASFLAGPVAPGEIVTLFGTGLGPEAGATLRLNERGLVDTMLAETRVLFDGAPAPVIYAQAGQVSAVAPYSIAGKTTVAVAVEYGGERSNALPVPVAAAAPGIFAVVNQDGSRNGPERPAARGSVVTIYATGEGLTDPPGVDGKPAEPPLASPTLPVSVNAGEMLYAGAAPGMVAGVLQVNVRVTQAGPLLLRVGDFESQSGVTVAVE